MLYPKSTKMRQTKLLDGIWNYQLDQDSLGKKERWPVKGLPSPLHMPVPSNFNDITISEEVRDYLGDVWYKTSAYIPGAWINGVDTVAGFHKSPPVILTEEFQVDFHNAYHHVFDDMENVVGERV